MSKSFIKPKSGIVTKIELEIAGQKIALTPDDARELLDALSSLLGVEPQTRFVPYVVPYLERPAWPYPHTHPWWTTTCGTGNDLRWSSTTGTVAISAS